MAKRTNINIFEKNQKLGLVLEGGGVKGAYQFGALKALIEAGFKFDGITGTSIGALNGALLVQGGYPKLEEFWADVRASKLFDIDDDMVEKAIKYDFDKQWVGKMSSIVRNLWQVVNSSSDKMRLYFSSFYDEEQLRKSNLDFGLVTFSVSDMKPIELFKEEIPNGQLIDYLIASACFPVYRFQRIDGDMFIDGGVWDNMPVNLLAQKDYKNIIVIRTKGKEPKRKLLYNDLNLVYITPSEDLGKAVAFTEERIDRNTKMGYYDTLRVLNGYMGTKYYLYPYNEKLVMSFLYIAPTVFYKKFVEDLTGYSCCQKSDCLSIICNIISEELELKTNEQEVIFMTLFELFGALCKVEKYEIYEPIAFMKLVACEAKKKGSTLMEFLLNTKSIRNVKLREIFFNIANYFG